MYVRFLPSEFRLYVASYFVPKIPRQINCLKTSGESYIVTWCHLEEEEDLYVFVYETRYLVLTFSPFYCKEGKFNILKII